MSDRKKLSSTVLTFLAVPALTGGAKAVSLSPAEERPSLGAEVNITEFSPFLKNLKTVGTAVFGICAITSLIFFILSVVKLSTSAGNEMNRSRALKGILISGISLALFGGAAVIVSVFWNIL